MADVLDEDFLQHFTVVGTSEQQHVNGPDVSPLVARSKSPPLGFTA
jgi:hypothetical protein